MMLDASTVLQIVVNLGALAMIYTRLETKIAVIETKVIYIERQVKSGAFPSL